MHDVFISYSHHDTEIRAGIVKKTESAGSAAGTLPGVPGSCTETCAGRKGFTFQEYKAEK